MVKIAFNSALAQKALEKEAAGSDKVRNLRFFLSDEEVCLSMRVCACVYVFMFDGCPGLRRGSQIRRR